ncbi:MAG TPA: GNAT family N-acetyltransferase [Candidatus Dojkabacteria bacterium]|nr:GNAT family N-acetyltransferase [Candidatus Dojkabacteria bacterium]
MTTETTFEIKDQQFELGNLELSDVEDLIEVAKQWVRNRFTGEIEEEELAEIERRMRNCPQNGYRYFVIRDNERHAIGCCAIREPEEAMQKYKSAPDSKTSELVNVFLDNEHRGFGLGYRLVNYMFEKAKELGQEEVIWNSGPRYKNSAWDFYNKLVGKPFTTAPAFYGIAPDGTPNDAPVWRKRL